MYEAALVDAEAFVPTALIRAALADNTGPSKLAVDLGIAVAGQPTAVLFRQIATANFETLWFLRKASHLGFRPVIVEYHADLFSAHNAYKRSLVVLPVVQRRNRHGQAIVQHHRLLSYEESVHHLLSDLILPSGETLPAFHRRLLTIAAQKTPFSTVELSPWLKQHKGGAVGYYPEFLSLFSGNVVMFEDFVAERSEIEFYERVIHPAYGSACTKLGQRPLITRLFSLPHRATSPLCYAFPAFVAEHVTASRRGML